MHCYMAKVTLLFVLLALIVVSFTTQAESEGKVAKIYYNGEISIPLVSKLINDIDDINQKKNIGRIYLYINSYGGDMDAGLMASSAIKSSDIPVTTVAMSTVGSAATLMLCAAKDRRSLPEGSIFMHPSWMKYNGQLRPNDIYALGLDSVRFNSMFSQVYRTCTTMTDKEIETLLYSESNKVMLQPEEAKSKGMISKIDAKIVKSDLSYYIFSPDK